MQIKRGSTLFSPAIRWDECAIRPKKANADLPDVILPSGKGQTRVHKDAERHGVKCHLKGYSKESSVEWTVC